MNYIELIGCDGVGKSTLLSEMKKQRKKIKKWLTPHEARIEIASKIEIKPIYKLHNVILNKIPLTDFIQKKISTIIFSQIELKISQDHLNPYVDFFDYSLKTFTNNNILKSDDKFINICRLYHVIRKNYALFEHFKIKTPIVLDEGVFKYCALDFDYLYTANPQSVDIIKPKAMIYCKLNFEDTINRYKKREIHRKYNPNFDVDFKAYYNMAAENSEKKVKLMEYLNVPVLTLDMSECIKKNTETAMQFINNII